MCGLWVAARRVLSVVGVVVVAVAALYGLLGPFTELIAGPELGELRGKERFDALTSTRQLVLASVGGALAAIGVVVTTRTYTANKRGQVTDRYGKAVALLACDKLDERLGGLYALEHVMRESPTDHRAVVDVLMAFIREHSADRVRDPDGDPRPGPDIQAAVDIVGRRPWRRERGPLDFTGARLSGADFTGARLEKAVFTGADLTAARFTRATLTHARFRGGSAVRADFSHARLTGADFVDVPLAASVFEDAGLVGTRFVGCDLRRTRFAVRSSSTVVLRDCVLVELDWTAEGRWRGIDEQDNELDPAAVDYFTRVRGEIIRRDHERESSYPGTWSTGDE
ncbi:pentapeptide repeat-containing protein [Actinokineospora xionganensis]|uniref:Pentapeptide repeat-containing protein n=1 Tax=Actinokineospora xionganensis TaxID=2684470 RepID=A0ABR7L0E4_9PSEU|nr:pentapeptide repeat-containing protein [Actinokineospora xionganensis]MBC6445988.1 pentapeptide repeat-containing protein [Actinokineospora xionganensis]